MGASVSVEMTVEDFMRWRVRQWLRENRANEQVAENDLIEYERMSAGIVAAVEEAIDDALFKATEGRR